MPLKKVIFVDDEPRILSAINRRLANEFEIFTFERGAEALSFLKQHNDISVLVADMRMPEMNGIEVLKQAMTLRPNTKRIMLTGNTDIDTAVSAINDGNVYRFLRKPCDAQKIRHVILEAIEDSAFDQVELETLAQNMSGQKDEYDQSLFLSVMSDELRTPLGQIISTANLMTGQKTEISEHEKARLLRVIGESGQSVLEKVDRILNYVHLETAPKSKTNVELFDLVDLINSEVSKVGEEAAATGCTISTDLRSEHFFVSKNKETVRIAIREMLTNAVRHNVMNGFVHVQFKTHENRAGLRISNTGNQSSHKALLARGSAFQSENTALNRVNAGMGLGLSLITAAARVGNFLTEVKAMDSGSVNATLVLAKT